ncbi:MAG: DegT/DnrJ/EryC1/StrS family aminotransferase [Acidimicrobiia bacterium]|nr:DegT/DnrJ/EryC1/StrS family aminotransferase [Acidimicrobiia bacterium]
MSAFPASPDRSAGFRVPLARPQLGQDELDAVAEVFASGALTNGPAVRRFEAQFAEAHRAAHGVAFGNGTVALAAMYLAAGIRPGDEVIVPSMTFISSATSLLHVGARPVFADIDPETLNLDPGDVARRIGPDTRAILVVHYGGQPADLDRLVELAEANELILLEDAAEAHGATFQGSPVGTFGLGGMFSFTPTKNMTTGEGGMVVTNDESYAHGLRILRNHGQENGGPVETLGYNWRMSDILAAVGSVQLLRLPFVLKRLRQLAERLDAGVAPLPACHRARGPARSRPHLHALHGSGRRRPRRSPAAPLRPGHRGARVLRARTPTPALPFRGRDAAPGHRPARRAHPVVATARLARRRGGRRGGRRGLVLVLDPGLRGPRRRLSPDARGAGASSPATSRARRRPR